jgi:hypothetical protein
MWDFKHEYDNAVTDGAKHDINENRLRNHVWDNNDHWRIECWQPLMASGRKEDGNYYNQEAKPAGTL